MSLPLPRALAARCAPRVAARGRPRSLARRARGYRPPRGCGGAHDASPTASPVHTTVWVGGLTALSARTATQRCTSLHAVIQSWRRAGASGAAAARCALRSRRAAVRTGGARAGRASARSARAAPQRRTSYGAATRSWTGAGVLGGDAARCALRRGCAVMRAGGAPALRAAARGASAATQRRTSRRAVTRSWRRTGASGAAAARCALRSRCAALRAGGAARVRRAATRSERAVPPCHTFCRALTRSWRRAGASGAAAARCALHSMVPCCAARPFAPPV
jgi:hypothetical protein